MGNENTGYGRGFLEITAERSHDMEIYRSICQECYMECGVLVHVKDGKVVRLEGDPESPVTEGDNICTKCLC